VTPAVTSHRVAAEHEAITAMMPPNWLVPFHAARCCLVHEATTSAKFNAMNRDAKGPRRLLSKVPS
jgi:hypothetical protein